MQNLCTFAPANIEPIYVMHDVVTGVTYTLNTIHGPVKIMIADLATPPKAPSSPIQHAPPAAAGPAPAPNPAVAEPAPEPAPTPAPDPAPITAPTPVPLTRSPPAIARKHPRRPTLWTPERMNLFHSAILVLHAEHESTTPDRILKKMRILAADGPEAAWTQGIDRIVVSSRLQKSRTQARADAADAVAALAPELAAA